MVTSTGIKKDDVPHSLSAPGSSAIAECLIDLRAAHPKNELPLIVNTDGGMVIDIKEGQLWNAP